MKRLLILSKMLLLLVCFTVMLFAQNSGSLINNRLLVPHVENAPTIDGVLDVDWDFPDVGMFVYVDDVLPEGGPTDLSALYRIAWNAEGIYFFGRVIDDLIDVAHADSWERDSWELYFDGGNEKDADYDANDVQWRWVYGSETGEPGVGQPECPNSECAWVLTANGYDFELAIPAGDLTFVPAEGLVIGWETQTNDNDGGNRETMTKWWSNSGDSYLHASLFGTAKLAGDDVTLEIPELEFAPIIDGVLDADWDGKVPEVAMTATTDQVLPDGGYVDFSTFYRIAWNAEGIYFFGRVIDDLIDVAHADSWERDCWELYFDGGNEKDADYDANDVQWRWVYGSETGEPGVGQPECPNSECAWVLTANGYDFELAIPAGDLTFVPAEGLVIGWETHTADNDGGNRETVTKWWSNSNDSYLHASLFGTAILAPIPIPFITVTSPNGGEDWQVGSSQNITWNSSGTSGDVHIEYSTNNGSDWSDVIASTSDDGTHSWTIPDAPSGNCLVKVSDTDGDPTDASDAVFTISPSPVPFISVTAPNGGEDWEVGSSQNITWNSSGTSGDVHIEYSTNNGSDWSDVIASTSDDGTHSWTIPDAPSGNCLVRVSDADGDPTDQSDAVFTISPIPFITVTSPNGGEDWQADSTYDITWTSSGTSGNVKIESSINNGSNWSDVIASTSDTGAYSWTIPDNPSDSCFVRIGDIDGSPLDTSDAIFTISTVSAVPLAKLPKVYSMSVREITTGNKFEIKYALPEKAKFRLEVYDIKGTRVKELSEESPLGFYSREIDMSNKPAGVYFIRMEANGKKFTKTNKFVLVR